MTSSGAVGYLHGDYAASLAGADMAVRLEKSGSWIVPRGTPVAPWRDAVGCYPLMLCREWSQLPADLDDLRGFVSLTAVTDPFGDYGQSLLAESFRDLRRPFKEHFVADLERDPTSFVSSHHRRYARKALREIDVEVVAEPPSVLDEWVELYAQLIARHGITGTAAFSRTAFRCQLGVPGLVMLKAAHKGATIGMLLWYDHGDVAYYHLAAYGELGYQLRASFGLFWASFEFFRARGTRWLSLGAGAGVHANADDGLSRFKRGWATGKRTAYLCGRIYDHAAYSELARLTRVVDASYFPVYRSNDELCAGAPREVAA